MRFRLLGRLEIGDGAFVRGARERKLLALLLLDAPAVVPRSALAQWVLGEDGTADESGVHIAVSRLRRQLHDQHVEATIERSPAGLRLLTDLDSVDSLRFKRLGRSDEAAPLADGALAATRRLGNPFFVAYTLYAQGMAFARTDPPKAAAAFTQGLAYATEQRQVLMKASIARDAARLENARGNLGKALELYDLALDVQHGSGNVANLLGTLASLAVGFDRVGQRQAAATLYGATAEFTTSFPVPAPRSNQRAHVEDSQPSMP